MTEKVEIPLDGKRVGLVISWVRLSETDSSRDNRIPLIDWSDCPSRLSISVSQCRTVWAIKDLNGSIKTIPTSVDMANSMPWFDFRKHIPELRGRLFVVNDYLYQSKIDDVMKKVSLLSRIWPIDTESWNKCRFWPNDPESLPIILWRWWWAGLVNTSI